MNVIKGRMRLFCVSNVIVSFVCAGFLGTNYCNTFEEVGQKKQNDLIAADEIIPLSQDGEGEMSIIESVVDVSDVKEAVEKEKKQQAEKQKKATNKVVTKSVVAKKEVASSVSYTPASYNEVTGTAIVNYAMRYLGLRYVYAGRSLATGTDCSGFTSLIYKEFGVSLPKTVGGQYNRGTYVSKSNLQKGDLVFYSGGGSYPTHVAMYIGNGKVIHESNYRDGVKISPLNMMRYISARRVINATANKIVQEQEEAKTVANTEKVEPQENVVNENVVNNSNDNVVNENVVNNSNENVNNENIVNEQPSNETSQSNQEIMDVKQEETSEEVNTNVVDNNVIQETNEVSQQEQPEEQKEVKTEVQPEVVPETPKEETPQEVTTSNESANNEMGQS